jgi:hypothetical protein
MFPKSMEAGLLAELKDGFRLYVKEAKRATPRKGFVTGAPIPAINEGNVSFTATRAIPSATEGAVVAGATIFTWWDDRTEIGIKADIGSSSASELLANIYMWDAQRKSFITTMASRHVENHNEQPIPLMPMRDINTVFAAVIEGKTKRYTVEFTTKASMDYQTWDSSTVFNTSEGQVTDLTPETKISVFRLLCDAKGSRAPVIKIETLPPATSGQ